MFSDLLLVRKLRWHFSDKNLDAILKYDPLDLLGGSEQTYKPGMQVTVDATGHSHDNKAGEVLRVSDDGLSIEVYLPGTGGSWCFSPDQIK